MNSESENVLKALSSSTRRTIMRQISEKGSATYTEIMHVLDLDPSLMSGKFNYHLKELSEVGLIEKTNGEYRITDLGKRGLILVDQVAKDVKIDRYGVLSAVMSMSPKKELELFTSQLGAMVGFMMTIFSIIPLGLFYGTWGFEFWLSVIAEVTALVISVVSTVKMIRIIRRFKLGFSAFVFVQSSWFFIRSPNRNSFFIITVFVIGFFLSFVLGFLLPYSGAMQLFTLEWYSLITSAMGSGLLSIAFIIRARKKADQLEETTNEQ
ncbi:MAG: winged helix-turn-helix domain-containing protein [Candidatus Thorarchaeota archaeon]|jgi:DNA-binding transcriptional ArsR family regulator